MQSTKELATAIRGAMQEKNIDNKGLAQLLGISSTMVEKLLCGDVVPSRHLEKKMVDALGIPPTQARRLAARREKSSTRGMARQEKTRPAA